MDDENKENRQLGDTKFCELTLKRNVWQSVGINIVSDYGSETVKDNKTILFQHQYNYDHITDEYNNYFFLCSFAKDPKNYCLDHLQEFTVPVFV